MKISVIIPAYNSERTIGRAIESVLNQTRPAGEIIVIDDGSADNTAELVRAFGSRVTLMQQENAGVSVARNAGIQAAANEWIAFLDADDEWLPNKLQCQTDHLARRTELKWTYANFYCKESGDKSLRLAHPASKPTGSFSDETFEDYLQAYANNRYAWTSTLIIHRDVFEKVGLFEPGMKRAQDNDLWFRIAYQYPQVGYRAEPLAIYHTDTPGSSTKVNDSVDFMVGLVQRHEKLSKQHHRFEALKPCLTQMLQVWIRSLIKQKRHKDAGLLLDQFKSCLPHRFCREMGFRMTIPVAGPAIANVVQSLKRRYLK